MCFNRFACVLLSVVLLLSCAREGERDAPPVKLDKSSGPNCISEMPSQLEQFVDGSASIESVDRFWACADESVATFERLTRGEVDPNNYSPRSVALFFEQYLIKPKTLNAQLLSSLMEVKRVILSGSSEFITRQELQTLRELLRELRAISQRLRVHAGIVFGKRVGATDKEQLAAAQSIQDAALQLGSWFQRTEQQDFELADLRTILEELAHWQNLSARAQYQDDVRALMAFLPTAKRVFVGGERAVIRGSEWAPLLNTIGLGYAAILGLDQAFARDLSSAFYGPHVPVGGWRIAKLLQQAVAQHGDPGIAMAEWRELFQELQNTGWLAENITADAMDGLFSWFVRRTLAHSTDPVSHLTPAHVNKLAAHLDSWLRLLSTLPQRGGGDPQTVEFYSLINSTTPQLWDQQNRLYFPTQYPREWQESDIQHLLWPYVIMNFLKEAYGSTAINFLTQAQLDTGVAEVLPLLQKFGWLESTTLKVSGRLMVYADSFMLDSNGDANVQIGEATRLLALVVSSFRSAQIWMTAAQSACGLQNLACLRELPLTESNILSSMPRLQREVGSGRLAFVDYMVKAEVTALEKIMENEATTADLLETWAILTYVETFLQHYDANTSEAIDLMESGPAFELYGPILARLVSSRGDDLLALFTFMLKYGETPDTKFAGALHFLLWKRTRNSWSFEADRAMLMNILFQLTKRL